MVWFVFAFVPVVCDAASNILEGHLSNKAIRNPLLLLFYLMLSEVALLPLVFMYRTPQIVSGQTLLLFGAQAVLYVGYVAFYLIALQRSDTSVVISLFSIGRILVPLLAFVLAGERLSLLQYVGFFLIVLSTTAMTTTRKNGKIVNNASFGLMLASSLLHSLESVIYKVILERVDWVTGLTYNTTLSALVLALVILPYRKDIAPSIRALKKNVAIFSGNAIICLVSHIGGTIAISLAPITLIKAVWSTQPIVVLIYSVMLQKRFPTFFQEQVHPLALHKKLIFFSLICVGAFCISVRVVHGFA